MTNCGDLMGMKKVKTAYLKVHGAGAGPLRVRKPLRRVPSLQDVRLPPPLKTDVDPVALLLEERQVKR